jgi:phage shock protein E
MGQGDSFIPGGLIIDVRNQDEYDSGHIEGCILIPISQFESRIRTEVPDKNTPVNLYCRSGARAGRAKSIMESLGYTQVSNLGGFSDAKSKIESSQSH